MQSILDTIKPIKLLAGPHKKTATTGQGCFMNVIAYLNGEKQITDTSPCVCPVVRVIAIAANDNLVPWGMGDRLIPYIHRAMGSATEDTSVIAMRAEAAARMALEMASIAGDVTRVTGKIAAEAAVLFAEVATDYGVGVAIQACTAAEGAIYVLGSITEGDFDDYAEYLAAMDQASEMKQRIADAYIKFLDTALPPADAPTQEIIDRAEKLVAAYRATAGAL